MRENSAVIDASLTSWRLICSYAKPRTDGQKHASTSALCEIVDFEWIQISTGMQRKPVRRMLEASKQVLLNLVESVVKSCQTKKSVRRFWTSRGVRSSEGGSHYDTLINGLYNRSTLN